jgi:hypothetical protein
MEISGFSVAGVVSAEKIITTISMAIHLADGFIFSSGPLFQKSHFLSALFIGANALSGL